MSNRLERVLLMKNEIDRGGFPSAKRLCELFEIKERTVYEDIRFLKERLQLEVEYDHFHKGYYNADPKKKLPELQLSDGEVFALTLGKEMLSQYTGTSFEPILRGALEKIYKSLPSKVAIDLSEVRSMVTFHAGPVIGISRRMFLELNKACEKGIQVILDYFSASKGELTQRIVEPYRLLEHRGSWYLAAYCCLRKSLRLFALHRIRDYGLLEERFVPMVEADLDAWVASAFLLEHGDKEEEVEIHFDNEAARYIRERSWHPTQEFTEHADGSCTLKFITQSLDEIKRWVLTYGAQAEVKAPEALRNAIKHEAKSLTEKYR